MILMKRSISSTTLLLFPIWEKNMYKIARTALLEAFHQSPLYKQILGLEVIDEFFRWCLKKLMHHALSGWMFGYWIWNAWKSRRKVMKFIPSIPLNSAWHFLFYLFTLIFFLLFFSNFRIFHVTRDSRYFIFRLVLLMFVYAGISFLFTHCLAMNMSITKHRHYQLCKRNISTAISSLFYRPLHTYNSKA